MKIFETKGQAEKQIIDTYGSDYFEFEIVNTVKVGPSLAKFLDCKEGYAIDKDIEELQA